MKTLNNYISEALIKKDTKISIYNYYPKDIFELREIIENRLKNDKNADLNDIDVSKITSFCDKTRGQFKDRGLFEGLDPHNIDVSNWNVSEVQDMRRVFFDCHNLVCDVSKWDVSNVESMSNMFYKCYKFDCDLGNWKFPWCKSLFGMFVKCSNFKGTGLEKWDVKDVHSFSHMFSDCVNLDVDLNDWNTDSATEYHYMFEGCDTLERKKLIPDWWRSFTRHT